MAKIDYTDLLICFYWAMDSLTRPTLRNLTAGYEEFAHRRDIQGLLQALRRGGLIERTHPRGRAVYRLTDKGRRRAQPPDPTAHWNRRWDGAWRVLTFDLPAHRKQDRVRLWRALRQRRFGLLQQSVWIWPHEMETALREIVEVAGVCSCAPTRRSLPVRGILRKFNGDSAVTWTGSMGPRRM
jgi:DNA-binding transcriptional regulator PaaX